MVGRRAAGLLCNRICTSGRSALRGQRITYRTEPNLGICFMMLDFIPLRYVAECPPPRSSERD